MRHGAPATTVIAAESDDDMAVDLAKEPRPEIQPKRPLPGEKNSVVLAKRIQSFTGEKTKKTTEKPKAKTTEKPDDDGDDWRFEIKRKKRTAGRKNSGSTAKDGWYYWVIRVNNQGDIMYYGTLDILEEDDPERLQRYWKRSKARKNGRHRE